MLYIPLAMSILTRKYILTHGNLTHLEKSPRIYHLVMLAGEEV